MRKDPSSKLERCYQNLKTELMRIELPENIANILQSMQVQNINYRSKSSTESGSKSTTTSGSSSATTLRTASSSQSSIGSAGNNPGGNTVVDSTSMVEVHQEDSGFELAPFGQDTNKPHDLVTYSDLGEVHGQGLVGLGGGLGSDGLSGSGGGAMISHPSLIEVIPIESTDNSDSEESEDGI